MITTKIIIFKKEECYKPLSSEREILQMVKNFQWVEEGCWSKVLWNIKLSADKLSTYVFMIHFLSVAYSVSKVIQPVWGKAGLPSIPSFQSTKGESCVVCSSLAGSKCHKSLSEVCIGLAEVLTAWLPGGELWPVKISGHDTNCGHLTISYRKTNYRWNWAAASGCDGESSGGSIRIKWGTAPSPL